MSEEIKDFKRHLRSYMRANTKMDEYMQIHVGGWNIGWDNSIGAALKKMLEASYELASMLVYDELNHEQYKIPREPFPSKLDN